MLFGCWLEQPLSSTILLMSIRARLLMMTEVQRLALAFVLGVALTLAA